jgi:hypothetical protein
MATKTSGTELKAFYADRNYWVVSPDSNGDDAWYEGLVLEVDGVEQGDDFSIISDLECGNMVTIVSGDVFANRENFPRTSFEVFFNAWREQQKTIHLAVTVPKDKEEAVRAAILAVGGSIK